MNPYVEKTLEGKLTQNVIKRLKEFCESHPDFLGNFRDLNFTLSTPNQDQKHSIDLTVVNVKEGIAKNIAIRCRNKKYLKYGDLTIRSFTKNGSSHTELYKIKNGLSYCNYYFYCWISETEDKILQYIIVDIDHLIERGVFEQPYKEKRNNDGSRFIAISKEQIYQNNAMVYDSIKHRKIKGFKKISDYYV